MTAGTTLPGTTALTALIDAVYATRSANLGSGTAVFNVIDPVTLIASWPNKDEQIIIRFSAKQSYPDTVTF